MGVTFGEVDVDDRVFFNWKQFFAFILFFILIVSYLVIPPLKEWVNEQLVYIFADWQLAIGFVGVIALSVGWYVLQAIGLFFVHLNIKLGSKLTSKGFKKFRYIFALYFLSMMGCYFGMRLDFFDPFFWVITTIIFFSVIIVYVGFYFLKKYLREDKTPVIKKEKTMFPKKPVAEEYIEFRFFSKYTLFILITILLIIFLISDAMLGNIGIIPFLKDYWELTKTNHFIGALFWSFICFTILWKPIIWIVLVLIPYVANYMIRYTIRRKILKIRIILFVFVVSLLLLKNLPSLRIYFGWTEFEYSLYTLILSIVTTLISAYLLRRWK